MSNSVDSAAYVKLSPEVTALVGSTPRGWATAKAYRRSACYHVTFCPRSGAAPWPVPRARGPEGMLRAALIGLPSTGKTTLFQLMTAVREPAAGGRATCRSASRRCPTSGSIALTAMYNPKKRVPATVEFADIGGAGAGGAKALVDVAAYKNADALVHVVRAFRDEAVRAPAGSVDPARDAQAMEDELILADLGVAERRLERIEKDLKKSADRPSSRRSATSLHALQGGARRTASRCARSASPATISSGCAASSCSRRSRCCSSSISTRRRRRRRRQTSRRPPRRPA